MGGCMRQCKIYPADLEREGECDALMLKKKVEDSRLTNIYLACRAVHVTQLCIYWDNSDNSINIKEKFPVMYFVHIRGLWISRV